VNLRDIKYLEFLFSCLYKPFLHNDIFCCAEITDVEEEQTILIKVFDKNKSSVF
jgi:hypothetical protein